MNIFFKFTSGVFFKVSFYLTSEKLLSQVFWLLVLKYFKVSFHSCRLECLEHTSESGQEASGTQISLLPGACDDSHWRGLNRGTEYRHVAKHSRYGSGEEIVKAMYQHVIT